MICIIMEEIKNKCDFIYKIITGKPIVLCPLQLCVLSARARARACVRACVRARVCVCVCIFYSFCPHLANKRHFYEYWKRVEYCIYEGDKSWYTLWTKMHQSYLPFQNLNTFLTDMCQRQDYWQCRFVTKQMY